MEYKLQSSKSPLRVESLLQLNSKHSLPLKATPNFSSTIVLRNTSSSKVKVDTKESQAAELKNERNKCLNSELMPKSLLTYYINILLLPPESLIEFNSSQSNTHSKCKWWIISVSTFTSYFYFNLNLNLSPLHPPNLLLTLVFVDHSTRKTNLVNGSALEIVIKYTRLALVFSVCSFSSFLVLILFLILVPILFSFSSSFHPLLLLLQRNRCTLQIEFYDCHGHQFVWYTQASNFVPFTAQVE